MATTAAQQSDLDKPAACRTTAEAIELVTRLVRPGDAILVKGSRSVGLEVVADALLEPLS